MAKATLYRVNAIYAQVLIFRCTFVSGRKKKCTECWTYMFRF